MPPKRGCWMNYNWNFRSTDYQRSSFRITNFKPDQISVTAQTFTSSKSVFSARSRIKPPVTSLGIFAAFLYQLTQIAPSTVMALRARGNCFSYSTNDLTNRGTMFEPLFGDFETIAAPAGSVP